MDIALGRGSVEILHAPERTLGQVLVPPHETIDTYQRDGVAVLRAVIEDAWLELLGAGVERNLAEPGPWAVDYTAEGEPGRFFGDYCNWQRIPEYRQFVELSGIAEIARQLMRSREARFFHEHVLVKEPGTREITPWHHDQPYYCVDGDQSVSLWIPLDTVPASAGVEFVRGSHRWGRWFVPRKFVDHTPYAPSDGRFELVPDLDAERDGLDIVTFDLRPGDAVAFHFRTVHDAPGTEALGGRRRAFSARFLGDDATFALRPWLHSPPFDVGELVEGGPLDDDRFPVLATAR
jgi:ectoine hydroxylase-related dioxygenase (phytanoyl-CoA dioxygenase family)